MSLTEYDSWMQRKVREAAGLVQAPIEHGIKQILTEIHCKEIGTLTNYYDAEGHHIIFKVNKSSAYLYSHLKENPERLLELAFLVENEGKTEFVNFERVVLAAVNDDELKFFIHKGKLLSNFEAIKRMAKGGTHDKVD